MAISFIKMACRVYKCRLKGGVSYVFWFAGMLKYSFELYKDLNSMTKKIISYLLPIISVCFLGFFLLVVYGIGSEALHSTNLEDANFGVYLAALGTYGDFVGGLTNPIIGSVGFIALMITISLQIKQNKKNAEQSYETSIFNLINFQNNIIENLKYKNATKRAAFTKFLDDNHSKFNISCSEHVMKPHHSYSMARIFYEDFNNKSNECFGHYFRNLYTILKTIDNLPESIERKKYYSRILRAQLSMSELTVLFLNCLHEVCDDGRFANLLVKYQMLEHLKVTSSGKLRLNYNIKNNQIDYKIGDKVIVSIYEMAYYIIGKKKISVKYLLSDDKTHGAFGKNKASCLTDIYRIALIRGYNYFIVYGDKKVSKSLIRKIRYKLLQRKLMTELRKLFNKI